MGLLVVGCSLLGRGRRADDYRRFQHPAGLLLWRQLPGPVRQGRRRHPLPRPPTSSADLTGKVELGIPEDDPRNPASSLTTWVDNVGDVAGMGADLFDSNVAAMASALVLAQSLSGGDFNNVSMVFCYAILGAGSPLSLALPPLRVGKKR